MNRISYFKNLVSLEHICLCIYYSWFWGSSWLIRKGVGTHWGIAFTAVMGIVKQRSCVATLVARCCKKRQIVAAISWLCSLKYFSLNFLLLFFAGGSWILFPSRVCNRRIIKNYSVRVHTASWGLFAKWLEHSWFFYSSYWVSSLYCLNCGLMLRLKTFKFIKAVSRTWFGMMNAVYQCNALVFIGLYVSVYQGCFSHLIWHDECRLSMQAFGFYRAIRFDLYRGYVSEEARLPSSDGEYKLLGTFKFIEAVSLTVFGMIKAVYHDKLLMFYRGYVSGEARLPSSDNEYHFCWILLSLSRLFLALYLAW